MIIYDLVTLCDDKGNVVHCRKSDIPMMEKKGFGKADPKSLTEKEKHIPPVEDE